MVPAAFSDNKQKAEDDSAAAIADCDDNDVERAGFDCIAIAANDVEIEPPEEELATLSVCKAVTPDPGLEPSDFTFTVRGNSHFPAQFAGNANCVENDEEEDEGEESPPKEILAEGDAGGEDEQGGDGDRDEEGRSQ